MTTETVLTNDQIMEQFELHIDDPERFRGCRGFARAIEQAVMQSLRDRNENQHQDDIAVDEFAAAMKAKLAKKRAEGRDGWQDMSATELSELLHEHVEKGDPLDVANLAMMLHQNGQSILQSPEIQALRNQDPLQGAANWIVSAITDCGVADIQCQLIIGYNRAKRLFDAAMEQQK